MPKLPIVATVFFLIVAAPAFATIVPQQGIHGVKVGMTPAQVKTLLGSPMKTSHGKNDFGTWVEFKYAALDVSFQSGAGATSIETVSAKERTDTGVGVGSSVTDVITKVTGAKCLKEYGYVHCYVGKWTPGQVVTDFSLKSGLVSRVLVGRVLD
jgi:hypothetical protein